MPFNALTLPFGLQPVENSASVTANCFPGKHLGKPMVSMKKDQCMKTASKRAAEAGQKDSLTMQANCYDD